MYCHKKIFLFLALTTSLATISQEVSYETAFPNLSFNFPVEIRGSVDGTNRLFVVEQPGVIKVFPNSEEVTVGEQHTYLDISSKVAYSAGQEIGLLGMAFHPNFNSNGYIFIYYIDRPENYRINIARYQVSSTNPNSIDASTETIIAQFSKNQSDSNHNGGKIAFGPDGYLYISIGDGGGAGDPQGNGQNLSTIFGSILRIDIDVDGNNPIENNSELPNGQYEIPSDNPLVGQTGLDELYAWGIRNTWKFSFDSLGNLWSADVGQNSYEEINLITRGGNYGWNKFEANSEPSYGSDTNLATNSVIDPIFFYDHSESDVSITGGYVYRGSLTSTSLQNNYIYGDYVSGRVWALNYNPLTGSTSNELLFKTNGQFISTFGEDENGELYFSDYGSNVSLYKLTETIVGPVTTPVNGIGEWRALSKGTNGIVESIYESPTGIKYIGGSFSNAGDIAVSNLAIINPEEKWESFGNDIDGVIYTTVMSPNGTLFVAGDFTTIDGIQANNIASWDGSTWSSLETGTNGPILALAFDQNGALFVGGVFTTAGNISMNNIARWQNDSWSTITDSSTGVPGTNNEIRSIAIDENNDMFVGGNFDTAGGVPASRIAKWDGTNWSALGLGTSGFVQAIKSEGDYLYVGGNFAIAGDKTVNRIARFNKTNSVWESLGTGVSGNVNDIVSDGTFIYVGGSFETASDDDITYKIVNNIARWSGDSGWEALGQNTNVGVNTIVNSIHLTRNNSQLIVGGNFNTAGNNDANNIAVWGEVFCPEESIIPVYQINGELQNGSNSISIIEGDTLILSMLPEYEPFSITLPNGTVVNDDYSLQNAGIDQSGTYIYKTEQGCSESVMVTIQAKIIDDDDTDGITNSDDACPNTPSGETVNANGCAISQLDSDNDGVNDVSDQCKNTPEGKSVDENGCSSSQLDSDNDGISDENDLCPNTAAGEIVDEVGCATMNPYPANQFKITTTGITCVSSKNGTITIESISTENFIAHLIGPILNNSLSFSEVLTITDLAKGVYDLCITAPNNLDYEHCSKIVITEPLPFEVQLNYDQLTNRVSLKMNGAKAYTIDINGKIMQTENEEVNFPLDEEVTNISVVTDQLCQGKFEETVIAENALLIYPNPVGERLSIDLKSLATDNVEIAIFTSAGLLIHSKNYRVEQSIIELNTSKLSSGVYFLRLKNDNINKSFKLFKN